MSSTAIAPTALVTEIAGRFSPVYVVDKRNMSSVATSTTTNSVNAFLPRVDTADANFSTPTVVIQELGTNYHVGEVDDLPDSKLKLTSYDVSSTVISLITGKATALNSEQIYGFNDLSTAVVDVVRQFADPNGNVFASMYQDNMVVDEFDASLKAKSVAMEDYSLSGFNMFLFRGYFITKAYVVQSADVTNGYLPIGTTYGTSEAPVALPVPTGTQPASYWIQRGSLNFLKIDRWRSGQGWQRFPEVTTAPVKGYMQYSGAGTKRLGFFGGDILAGDVIYATYASYQSNVGTFAAPATPSAPTFTPSTTGGVLTAGTTYNYRISALNLDGETLAGPEGTAATVTGSTGSIAIAWTAVAGATKYNVYGRTTGLEQLIATVTTNAYTDTGALNPSGVMPVVSTVAAGATYDQIPQLTPDTGDPVGIPTRLTPFSISANLIARGQSLDIKMMLKRERAEGIGDVDGIWGVPDSPDVTVDFEVKMTDFGLYALMTTGNSAGTDTNGTVNGDFFDPNYMTRVGLASNVPLVATLYDPRNAGVIVKTYTCPSVTFKTTDISSQAKSPVSTKFTGTDRVGNMSITCYRGAY